MNIVNYYDVNITSNVNFTPNNEDMITSLIWCNYQIIGDSNWNNNWDSNYPK